MNCIPYVFTQCLIFKVFMSMSAGTGQSTLIFKAYTVAYTVDIYIGKAGIIYIKLHPTKTHNKKSFDKTCT